MVGFGFASDGSVFDAPEVGIAVPALKALAVEDLPESGFVSGRELLSADRACDCQCEECRYVPFHIRSRHRVRTLTHVRLAADSSTASVTSSVSMPSRKVGDALRP